MENKILPKNAEFYCLLCDFNCSKKSNFEIHNNTKKHLRRLNGTQMEPEEIKKNANYTCNCGKEYATKSGLWKHKTNSICTNKLIENADYDINETKTNDINDKEVILMLLHLFTFQTPIFLKDKTTIFLVL